MKHRTRSPIAPLVYAVAAACAAGMRALNFRKLPVAVGKMTPLLLVGLCAVTFSSCAHGPSYRAESSSTPALTGGKGRIYIYRPSVFGAAIQPAITVNGERVGRAKPGGYVYVDRPPGTYTIRTHTEVTRTLDVPLAAGEVRYVQLRMSMGVWVGRVTPVLVNNSTGEKQIARCRHMAPERETSE